MEPVGPGGEAVLDYSVFDAKQAGFGKFIFVIRRAIEQDFRDTFGRRFARHVNVDYAFQELDMVPPGHFVSPDRKKPWGTGHAVLCAAPVAGPPFRGHQRRRLLRRGILPRAGAVPDPEAHRPPPISSLWWASNWTAPSPSTAPWRAASAKQIADGYLASVEELTAIERQPGGTRNREAGRQLPPLDRPGDCFDELLGLHAGRAGRAAPPVRRVSGPQPGQPQGRVLPADRRQRADPGRAGAGEGAAHAVPLVWRNLSRGPPGGRREHPGADSRGRIPGAALG